jgi:hypothetical protein
MIPWSLGYFYKFKISILLFITLLSCGFLYTCWSAGSIDGAIILTAIGFVFYILAFVGFIIGVLARYD